MAIKNVLVENLQTATVDLDAVPAAAPMGFGHLPAVKVAIHAAAEAMVVHSPSKLTIHISLNLVGSLAGFLRIPKSLDTDYTATGGAYGMASSLG